MPFFLCNYVLILNDESLRIDEESVFADTAILDFLQEPRQVNSHAWAQEQPGSYVARPRRQMMVGIGAGRVDHGMPSVGATYTNHNIVLTGQV
ncbi:hypothetical protein AN451_29260 [Pseudomonas aeruginosa]|nr:hypothetical protein AN451_29260 [Pseudomonas aeruginosa]